MSDIKLRNGCIFYYGNIAGYVEKDTAIVDLMFQGKELSNWLSQRKLTAKWTEGVFERLSSGEKMLSNSESLIQLKKCRIWQLKADVDPRCKFIGYVELQKEFGEPNKENYKLVYDGELETNDLESIYAKFNLNHPLGFTGHSLSMSDVVELYDSKGSEFHYVDHFGFKKIDFEPQDQTQKMNMSM